MAELVIPVEAGATYEIAVDIEYRAVPPTFADAAALVARWFDVPRWVVLGATSDALQRRARRAWLSRMHSAYRGRRR